MLCLHCFQNFNWFWLLALGGSQLPDLRVHVRLAVSPNYSIERSPCYWRDKALHLCPGPGRERAWVAQSQENVQNTCYLGRGWGERRGQASTEPGSLEGSGRSKTPGKCQKRVSCLISSTLPWTINSDATWGPPWRLSPRKTRPLAKRALVLPVWCSCQYLGKVHTSPTLKEHAFFAWSVGISPSVRALSSSVVVESMLLS